MSTGAALTFHLPQGWTLRKVVMAMVQEWLPPFRTQPAFKAARWVVQSVMEGADETPLWEPGIETAEYESRLDRFIRCWAIRATAGRGKGTILARFSVDADQPGVLKLTGPEAPFPETLFDAGKMAEFLKEQGADGGDSIFAALLAQHGFKRAE